MHLSSANPRQKRDNDLSVHEERRRVEGGGRWQHPGKRRLRGGGRELEAVRGQGLPGGRPSQAKGIQFCAGVPSRSGCDSETEGLPCLGWKKPEKWAKHAQYAEWADARRHLSFDPLVKKTVSEPKRFPIIAAVAVRSRWRMPLCQHLPCFRCRISPCWRSINAGRPEYQNVVPSQAGSVRHTHARNS